MLSATAVPDGVVESAPAARPAPSTSTQRSKRLFDPDGPDKPTRSQRFDLGVHFLDPCAACIGHAHGNGAVE